MKESPAVEWIYEPKQMLCSEEKDTNAADLNKQQIIQYDIGLFFVFNKPANQVWNIVKGVSDSVIDCCLIRGFRVVLVRVCS